MRFSLKTLLLFAAISAVAIGIWAREYRFEQRRLAAMKLLHASAEINEDDGICVRLGPGFFRCGNEPHNPKQRNWSPEELRQLHYVKVDELELNGHEIPAGGWATHLAPLTDLKSLEFRGSDIDREGFIAISRLPNIERLIFDYSMVPDDCCDLLGKMATLTELKLPYSKHVHVIGRFPQLKVFKTQSGNATVVDLPRLESLDIGLRERASLRLEMLPALHALTVRGRNVRIDHDSSFRLNALAISGDSDDFLTTIEDHPLNELAIGGIGTSSNIAAAIQRFRSLTVLTLEEGHITADVLSAVAGLNSLEQVTFSDCTFGPGVENLDSLSKNVKRLKLVRTTPPGGEHELERMLESPTIDVESPQPSDLPWELVFSDAGSPRPYIPGETKATSEKIPMGEALP